jgi:MYXO-CTERM domain-containing protein
VRWPLKARNGGASPRPSSDAALVVVNPNGIFQAQIQFPAALHDFRGGAGDLTPTDTGFAVRASEVASGPDEGALFRGTMTARTVSAQALEPATVILAAAGLAGAAFVRRRSRSS